MALIAYYPLAEAEGATQAHDASGNGAPPLKPEAYLTYQSQSAPVFGTAAGPFGGGGQTALQLTAPAVSGTSSSKILRGHVDGITIATVDLFFTATDETGTLVTPILFRAGPIEDHVLSIGVLEGGGGELTASGSAGWSIIGATNVRDGKMHHACLRQNGANIELYLDGALIGSDAGTLAPVTSYFIGPAISDVDAMTMTLSHVAIYDTALTPTQIADRYNAGMNGFSGETAEDRLARYAGYAGIPTAEYSFSTNANTPMAYMDTTGQSVMELMQRVAETDGGVLYEAPDGTLTYKARSARYNTAASPTLDVSAGEVEVGYSPKLDRSALTNRMTAKLSDGTYSTTAENTTSTAEYGIHSPGELELYTTDNDHAHAAAWWRVNTYGEPSARVSQLTVELAKMTPARQARILSIQVGDRIAVSNLPSQSDTSTKEFFVEGWTETISDSQLRIEFNVSPAAGFDVWEIEHPTFGQYDAYPLAY